MTSSVGSQIARDLTDSMLTVTFDPAFRDAMQGGGRWKRFIRIEETPAGIHISADTLFQLIWNILWGRGSQYRHTTARLQRVVQQLHSNSDPQLDEPFKLFCSHVITSRIRSGHVGQSQIADAVQLLLGLKLILDFSAFAQIPQSEVCDRIIGRIRSGIEPAWKAAVAELLDFADNDKWLDRHNIDFNLFQAIFKASQSAQDLALVFKYFHQRSYTNESSSLPYTLGELKKILKDPNSSLPEWQQALFSSSDFKRLVFNFSNQMTRIPDAKTHLNAILSLDVLVLAWKELQKLIDSSMMSALKKINRDADSVLVAAIALMACSKLSASSIEKLKRALQEDIDGIDELRAEMNMQLALDYLRL